MTPPSPPEGPQPDDGFELFVRATAPGAARRLDHTCRLVGLDVQDILQEAYVRALDNWTTVAKLRPAQRQAWVDTTAGRLLADRLRSPDHRKRENITITELTLSDTRHSDLGDWIHARDRLRRVCTLIRQLTEREQNVVIMYALLGHDYETIAEHLGTSIGAVTTTMSRARARLAKLDQEGGHE